MISETIETAAVGVERRRQKLADILYWDVLQQIRTGACVADQKLPSEKELCQRFGVSRPVVREALERLKADGLIYSRQGAGSFVKGAMSSPSTDKGATDPPRLVKSIADVSNVYDFRLAFEGEVAYAAAAAAEAPAIEDIRAALARMEEALSRNDPALDEDIEFHIAVARATRNQFYVEVLKMMQPHMRFVMELVMKLSIIDSVEHNMAVRTQHAAVLERIRARDPEGARRAMRTMLTNARNRVFHGIDSSRSATDL
jgi:DNA-binding FadR family transcriptional regulator